MKTLAAWLALCGCAIGAQDERFGFDTHFHYEFSQPEQNPVLLPRMAATTPASYIREDIGWVDGETSQGIYINGTGVRTSDQQIIDAANSAGLKVVLIFNQYYVPSFYMDLGSDGKYHWPNMTTETAKFNAAVQAAANYCATVAKGEEGKIAVIEVCNEMQNDFPNDLGSNWEAGTVQLTSSIHDAVHAVSQTIKVIGYGGQGSQVLAMLQMSLNLDGVVYHPYNDTNVYGGNSPESCYEPPYSNYMSFVQAVKSGAPNMPIWETECSQNSGETENANAVWIARRLMMSSWLGVSHTFLFEYISGDLGRGALFRDRYPRVNEAVLRRVYSILGSDSWAPGSPMVPDSHVVTVSPADANFMGFNFHIGDATWPRTTMAVVWEGFGPYLNADPPGSAQVTIYHPNAGTVLQVDLVTGETRHLQNGIDWSQQGSNVVIPNAVIGQDAVAYKIWNGAVTVP